jgi:hypothetical protein
MSSKTRTLAIALSAVLVLSVLGSGLALAGTASAMANNADDGDVEDDGNETNDARPFGQVVSAYVHGLIDGSNDTNDTNATNDTAVPLGQQIAAFVVANNPGNAPDHAGPGGQPDHAGAGNETGKPAHAGPGNETSQPDHAGPDGEDDDGDADDDNGGGPPAHAGNDD